MKALPGLIVLGLVLCTSSLAAAESTLRAERLTDANWAALYPGGPDAIAGRGDWALSNGHLCAIVSDLEHESGMTAWGGILVDLGNCGLANDQWLLTHLLPNLKTNDLTKPESLDAQVSAEKAMITVAGLQQGLELVSRYSLDLEQPDRLLIRHRVTRVADGEPLRMLGAMVLHPGRALTPFALSTSAPEYSLGFDLLKVDRSDEAVMLAAMQPGDMTVLLGAQELQAPISYGLRLLQVLRRDAAGSEQVLDNFAITDAYYSLYGVLSDKPWLGTAKPGVWNMLQSRWMDLARGESLEMLFAVRVAPRVDVAAITDHYYTGPSLVGQVDDRDSHLLIYDRRGHPLSAVRPDERGNFSLRLPSDTRQVQAELLSKGGTQRLEWTFDESASLDVGRLQQVPAATVELPAGYPMRLVFKGEGGTPDPRFFDDFTGINSAGKRLPNSVEANYLSLGGVDDDPTSAQLPAGDYQVYATRGLEYHVTQARLSLAPGARVKLEIAAPTRALESPGQISADLHVHSAVSFDSALPLRQRVRSFAASGAEVLVSSEHNRLVDYRQLVRDMGLHQQLRLIPGVEFTGMAYTPAVPYTNGHTNVFPLPYREREFSGGLPAHEGVRLRDLVQWTREQSPNALFQLNHPRVKDAPDPGLAYFDHLGVGQTYDPALPLSAPENSALVDPNAAGVRDVDFDLLEVLNGHDMALYRLVQADWFSLLRQGETPTGSANSDSHDSDVLVGVPTNYVSVVDDDPATLDEAQLLASLRAGRVFGTSGPLLQLEVASPVGETAGPGEMLSCQSCILTVGVKAAPWVPVDRLVVYLDGAIASTHSLTAGDTVSIPLEVDRDSFLVVEVDGLADALYSAVLPGFTPLAFSNPVRIDGDGDGVWQGSQIPASAP